ncbi:MAG: glutamate-1-semialdehyde 2,1-aminomutase [Desulfobacteraceae bacterium]|nr:glutamate-1-semialdehyde 2,1-aminomutase [Desulfobacteraceae bacterium]
MLYEESKTLFQKAIQSIPGGVNSPVRACRSVNSDPLFIKKAQGCRLVDADGNTFIDYIGSWGPMILGHQHPNVVDAIAETLKDGCSFGAPTELEIELADLVIEAVASVEMVRMVNSGTEATMSAIRLARGITGKELIIKFDGCYHGHADSLLVEAGSGVATLGIPGSPGVPSAFASRTISLPYNDKDRVSQVMDENGGNVACIIVEPVAGNMGLVTPSDGFLQTLRDLTRKHDSLLIFDEVMTGFRVSYGGAQTLFDISPDITCFGKIIGGGLPVGAYGGSQDIMGNIAPAGSIYQAGTLSGNPLAMAAGIATLKEIQKPGFYDDLDLKSAQLFNGLIAAAEKVGIPVSGDRVGSMLGLYFSNHAVRDYNDAKKSDLNRFSAYYKLMREEGIYLAPSQFEALFVSAAHEESDIEATITAAEKAMAALSK